MELYHIFMKTEKLLEQKAELVPFVPPPIFHSLQRVKCEKSNRDQKESIGSGS